MASELEILPPEKPKALGRPFQKGQSGNPGGRPREYPEIQNLARSHAPEAIAALVDIMKTSSKDNARVAAAVALLDRAFGKPSQTVEVSGNVDVEYAERLFVEIARSFESARIGTPSGADPSQRMAEQGKARANNAKRR